MRAGDRNYAPGLLTGLCIGESKGSQPHLTPERTNWGAHIQGQCDQETLKYMQPWGTSEQEAWGSGLI